VLNSQEINDLITPGTCLINYHKVHN